MQLILIILISVFSCSEDKKTPFELPKNAVHLIAGDSAKTWKLARRFNNNTRMNMGDCFLSYRVTYKTDSILHDNNSEHRDCGESLSSKWTIYHSDDNFPYVKIKGGNLQELMDLKKNYKFFKILDLSKDQMILEFTHKQFSNKTTTMVDVFVTENAVVNDRNFHW